MLSTMDFEWSTFTIWIDHTISCILLFRPKLHITALKIDKTKLRKFKLTKRNME